MPGDGSGQEFQFREVLKACDDPAADRFPDPLRPRTCRTGAATALYRFERDGWTVEAVVADGAVDLSASCSRRLRHGPQPSRPGDLQPAVALDRNLLDWRSKEAGTTDVR